MRKDSLFDIPKNLPIPQDDGACSHLVNFKLPNILLS